MTEITNHNSLSLAVLPLSPVDSGFTISNTFNLPGSLKSVTPKNMQPASNFIALNQHLTQRSFELGGRTKCILGMVGSWAGGRKVLVSVIPIPLWNCVCNTDLQIRT